MNSSTAESSPPQPLSPAVPEGLEPVYSAPASPPFWPRFARASGLVAVAASLHVWGVSPARKDAPSVVVSPAMLQALAMPSLPGSPKLMPGIPAAAPARRVVVETTLVTAAASPAVDSSLGLDPAMPVGTTGRTMKAAAIGPAASVALPLPPARIAAEVKRTENAAPASPALTHPAGVVVTAATAAPAATAPAATNATAASPAVRAAEPTLPAPDSKRSAPTTLAGDLSRQRETVLAVLKEYSRAYERLDVSATKAVYPNVDGRKLQRAFQELEEQQVRFASCDLSISSSGAGANARCRGDATFRPKVGSRIVRLTNREWTFSLAREGGNWQILDARMQ